MNKQTKKSSYRTKRRKKISSLTKRNRNKKHTFSNKRHRGKSTRKRGGEKLWWNKLTWTKEKEDEIKYPLLKQIYSKWKDIYKVNNPTKKHVPEEDKQNMVKHLNYLGERFVSESSMVNDKNTEKGANTARKNTTIVINLLETTCIVKCDNLYGTSMPPNYEERETSFNTTPGGKEIYRAASETAAGKLYEIGLKEENRVNEKSDRDWKALVGTVDTRRDARKAWKAKEAAKEASDRFKEMNKMKRRWSKMSDEEKKEEREKEERVEAQLKMMDMKEGREYPEVGDRVYLKSEGWLKGIIYNRNQTVYKVTEKKPVKETVSYEVGKGDTYRWEEKDVVVDKYTITPIRGGDAISDLDERDIEKIPRIRVDGEDAETKTIDAQNILTITEDFGKRYENWADQPDDGKRSHVRTEHEGRYKYTLINGESVQSKDYEIQRIIGGKG